MKSRGLSNEVVVKVFRTSGSLLKKGPINVRRRVLKTAIINANLIKLLVFKFDVIVLVRPSNLSVEFVY